MRRLASKEMFRFCNLCLKGFTSHGLLQILDSKLTNFNLVGFTVVLKSLDSTGNKLVS